MKQPIEPRDLKQIDDEAGEIDVPNIIDKKEPEEVTAGAEMIKISDGSKEITLSSCSVAVNILCELVRTILTDKSFQDFLKLNNCSEGKPSCIG